MSINQAEEVEDKYVRDDRLQKAVEDVMSSGKFAAREFEVGAVFAKGRAPADREAASCRKIPSAARTFSNVDFLLVFWKKPWDSMTTQERHRLIVHEVSHIAIDAKGNAKVRRHSGDFCEIWEHDLETQRIAKEIPVSPALAKFDRQTTMKEVAT